MEIRRLVLRGGPLVEAPPAAPVRCSSFFARRPSGGPAFLEERINS
jgi:hypothetical protein